MKHSRVDFEVDVKTERDAKGGIERLKARPVACGNEKKSA